MRFTLFFRGHVPSKGNAEEKHRIRCEFHTQLKDLWTRPPLTGCSRLLDPDVGELSLIRHVHDFTFAPLVAEHVGLVAELDVLLLWKARPGSIITAGGDIDNRLKTLLDALKVPTEKKDLPQSIAPQAGETPFFCLLGDDRLLTRLNAETDRRLETDGVNSSAVAVIRVETKQFRPDLRMHPLTAGLG